MHCTHLLYVVFSRCAKRGGQVRKEGLQHCSIENNESQLIRAIQDLTEDRCPVNKRPEAIIKMGTTSSKNLEHEETLRYDHDEERTFDDYRKELRFKPPPTVKILSPTTSTKAAVNATLAKLFSGTSRKIYMSGGDEYSSKTTTTFAGFMSAKTPKTCRTSVLSNGSRSDNGGNSSVAQQSMLILQPSRLSFGSISSMGTEYIHYPVNHEIFSKLYEGSAIFATNKSARLAFIKFIRSKQYIQSLAKPLLLIKQHELRESERQLEGIKFNNYNISARQKTAHYEETVDHFMSRIHLIQQLKINDTRDQRIYETWSEKQKASPSKKLLMQQLQFEEGLGVSECFDFYTMKNIVIATLYPMFMQSAEYKTYLQKELDQQADCVYGALTIEENSDDSSQISIKTTGSHATMHTLELLDLHVVHRESGEVVRGGQNNKYFSTPSSSFIPSTTEQTAPTDDCVEAYDTVLTATPDKNTFKTSAEYQKIKHIYLNTIDLLTNREIDELLRSSTWISDFLTAIDQMPVSVSIATANKEHRHFPTVYVNNAYENLTLYKKRDVIGKNQKFLQMKNGSEESQINQMSHALYHGNVCKVALSNVRKDGREMFNFVALHPVYVTETITHNEALLSHVSSPTNSLRRMLSNNTSSPNNTNELNNITNIYTVSCSSDSAHLPSRRDRSNSHHSTTNTNNTKYRSTDSNSFRSNNHNHSRENSYRVTEKMGSNGVCEQEVYKYVIGIQYDIANSAASVRELKMIDDYMLILSNMLK